MNLGCSRARKNTPEICVTAAGSESRSRYCSELVSKPVLASRGSDARCRFSNCQTACSGFQTRSIVALCQIAPPGSTLGAVSLTLRREFVPGIQKLNRSCTGFPITRQAKRDRSHALIAPSVGLWIPVQDVSHCFSSIERPQTGFHAFALLRTDCNSASVSTLFTQ